MVCQLWYCRTDCLNTLQMYTENAKQLAFCVTIWYSSELCYKEKEIYTTYRTLWGANHCRLSCMSGALLWWGEEYWLKLVLEESRDAKSCVSRFICVFDIGVFRVDWVCNGLLVRRKILRLYKAGALWFKDEECWLKLLVGKSRDAKSCVSRFIGVFDIIAFYVHIQI